MTVTLFDAAETDRAIGLSLKLLVRARGRTMRDLAEAVGMSYSAINERLVGKRHFLAGEVAALAAELGVEPGVLYRGRGLLPCTFGQLCWSEATNDAAVIPVGIAA